MRLSLALVILFLGGCPNGKLEEPVRQPTHPPDHYQNPEDEALESATPNDSTFPFDPEGTGDDDES